MLNHLCLWNALFLPVSNVLTVLCQSLKGEEHIRIVLKKQGRYWVQYVTSPNDT